MLLQFLQTLIIFKKIFGPQYTELICSATTIHLPASPTYCCFTTLGKQANWFAITLATKLTHNRCTKLKKICSVGLNLQHELQMFFHLLSLYFAHQPSRHWKSQFAHSDINASPRICRNQLQSQIHSAILASHASSLDPLPHSFVSSSPSSIIIPTIVIHHSFTLSLQAQNLPFRQILPILILLPRTAFTIMGSAWAPAGFFAGGVKLWLVVCCCTWVLVHFLVNWNWYYISAF